VQEDAPWPRFFGMRGVRQRTKEGGAHTSRAPSRGRRLPSVLSSASKWFLGREIGDAPLAGGALREERPIDARGAWCLPSPPAHAARAPPVDGRKGGAQRGVGSITGDELGCEGEEGHVD
jgi:hypothetical protein